MFYPCIPCSCKDKVDKVCLYAVFMSIHGHHEWPGQGRGGQMSAYLSFYRCV